MMDVLRPGHAHRSSSDRLLSNYLDSQKHLSQSLLALLSHSHASTSSLLAYTTSSPGVLIPVRKAVRHAGFEGPLSGALLEAHGSQVGSMNGHGQEDAGWHAYITCLDSFRADLKHIHHLEEEVSRVKRDREILVSRLIKTTKSRPSKNDISAIAKEYSQASMSGRESSLSMTSNGSHASKESKRAGKLADAQAELLGCEEHLRSLELKIEHERNNVMMAGLEDRFRAMEAVGQMWIAQAKKGLGDLERGQGQGRGHGSDAYELDSNGSIAPSQSASQLGTYEDSPRRHTNLHKSSSKHYRPNGPGSITGSIAEEDESSDDEPHGALTVHENRPGSTTPRPGSRAVGGGGAQRSPLGLSSMRAGSYNNAGQGNDSDSSDGNPHRGGRRAASDIGVAGGGLYKPPNSRIRGGLSLHRTLSADRRRPPSPRRRRSGNGSDSSSARGVPVKKKGFFASIGRLFRGSGNKRSSRGSNAGSSIGGGGGGGWKTRTDKNLKGYGGGGGRGGDSSSDDEPGLVAVSNNRNSTWSVDNVGVASGGGGGKGLGRSTSLGGNANKRSSNTPIASGLIPAPPNKRQSSQSTITTPTSRSGARSPTGTGQPQQAPGISRSNTMRSTASTATAKTATTVRSSGTATKKTRPNGSISRTARSDVPATDRNSMMALVNKPTTQTQGPTMPDVPKAPKSQVTPQLSLPTAPGSSIVRPGDISGLPRSTSTSAAMAKGAAGTGKPGITRSTSVGGQSAGAGKKRISTSTSASQSGAQGGMGTGQNAIYGDDELYPHHSISRSNSVQRVPTTGTTSGNKAKAETANEHDQDQPPAPRPPSRLLAPPLKSALRPSSPSVPSEPLPKIEMFSISAPKPVEVEREQHRASFPAAAPKPAGQSQSQSPIKDKQIGDKDRPRPGTRNSYQSMTTDAGESVYESAMEDEGEGGGEGEGKLRQVTGADIKHQGDDSSSDEEGWGGEGYDVVDNERVKRLGINIDYDEPHRSVPRGQARKEYREGEEDSDGTAEPSPVAKRQSQTQEQAPPAKEGSIAGESSVSRRKSVRIRGPDSPTGPVSGANVGTVPVAPTKVHGTTASASGGNNNEQDGSDGEARQRSQAQWDTRIGRMRDDSSDEEEEEGDDEYKRAKRGLMRNTGDFKGVGGEAGKGKSGSKGGVRRSKSSASRG